MHIIALEIQLADTSIPMMCYSQPLLLADRSIGGMLLVIEFIEKQTFRKYVDNGLGMTTKLEKEGCCTLLPGEVDSKIQHFDHVVFIGSGT